MMTGNYLQQLNRMYERQAKLMEQTDGSSLHRPSDNPVNYTKNMIYNTNLTQNDQYTDNVNAGVSWMKSSDSAMTNMADILSTVVEKTVASASDKTTDPTAIGIQVTALVQEAVTQANSQLGGRYLFSGQSDTTKPFELSPNKYTRGLTKTLDDTQSSFFSDTVDATGTVTYSGGATQTGDLKQMLTMTSGNDTYYLNTTNGNIYTKDFVSTGYKDAKNVTGHGDTVKAGDEYATTGGAVAVGTYFDTNGTLKPVGSAGITISGKTYNFATVAQQIVTYKGDANKISMVKQNGAINSDVDSVNVTGQELFGAKDIFGGSAGTVALNDTLAVAAKMTAGDSKWLSSDGITMVNNAHDTVINAQTKLAARTTVYNDAIATLDTQKTIITTDITNVSATDVSALAVKLMTAQTLYNMSLSVGSKILPKSLVDYL